MSTTSHLSLVNVAPDSTLAGHAVIGLVLAQAATRDHLQDAILSFQFHKERGIGVQVADAGQRQHLGHALGLEPPVTERRTPEGTVQARSGFHLEIPITVWNLEP